MEQKHTPEPWRVTGTGTIRYIDAPVGNGMLQEVASCMRVEYGDMEANARRIVACVNACTGMPQSDLEELAKVGVLELTVYADDMRLQRDQLLASLEELVDQNDNGIAGVNAACWQRARAAIAAVKGGAA